MQQELYNYAFLNYLSLYSLARWIELPTDERIFNEIIQPVYNEEDFGDDEIVKFYSYIFFFYKIFKFVF